MTTFLIATKTFAPLVLAQAKARKIETRLIVVNHPIGGLNAQELAERIESASSELTSAIAA
ncbi:MAG: hypothetical protein ACI8W7_004910 [Gammaproteobacteria bacterium]